jgi:hypothetical protein
MDESKVQTTVRSQRVERVNASPRHLSSQRSIQAPLDRHGGVPANAVPAPNGVIHQATQERSRAPTDTKAATDDLATLLFDIGCNQWVRGTLKSRRRIPDNGWGWSNMDRQAGAIQDCRSTSTRRSPRLRARFTGLSPAEAPRCGHAPRDSRLARQRHTGLLRDRPGRRAALEQSDMVPSRSRPDILTTTCATVSIGPAPEQVWPRCHPQPATERVPSSPNN